MIYRYKQLVPITFLTGFYVSEVVRRYWDQFMSLPFPDNLALKLVTYVHGKVTFIAKRLMFITNLLRQHFPNLELFGNL